MASISSMNDREGTLTDSGGTVTVQDLYLLTMDAPSNTVEAFDILQIVGAPEIQDPHPNKGGLLVVSRALAHKDASDTTLFILTVNYSNSISLSEQGNAENPLDVPTKYTYDQVDEVLAVEIDPNTNKRIVNSAGRPFSAITENFPLTRIIVQRNEKTFSEGDADYYRNTMNRGPITINGDLYGNNNVKIERITGSPQTDTEGTVYYQVVYSAVIKNPDWKRLVVDRGTVDINGKPPGRNVRLDSEGAGLLLEGDFQTADYDDEEVALIEFSTLREVSYGPLRL